ncbi:plexin-B2 [Ornithorhynchus anatinus]|uniref:Plexin B2 n=1 Tax=Ornithorhynchus anatinus TaxID=9258 RepID=F6YUA4_ORNAN|nr:plexin-B2 [Ornithorhynchus anatinus]XP_028934546.1 plexin-B2 [Ornithorhynchus anatinus]XP_028934547.1 plexin-B2 [Ornithorhynchus anatinus]XP_028934548.1 plexin-B2 [Ornithorhynchus anatinus]
MAQRLPPRAMAPWVWGLTILSCFWASGASQPRRLDFFSSPSELNHLVTDPATGTVYLGAVNRLYQLTADLRLVQEYITGPAKDNKKCTPPIDTTHCQEAMDTDNVNKLLVLDRPKARLVVCGSLFKGICTLHHKDNISEVLFYEDDSGEKSFVASNDERVATVGLVTDLPRAPAGTECPCDRVLFVGKGNGPHDNGIIISTRLLDRQDGKEPFEAYTDHTAFKTGYLVPNTQQFVAVFEDGAYVFFIFNHQDKHPAKNRTLIARMCKHDPSYYSYFEMDLECHRDGETFGVCLAASVATPGGPASPRPEPGAEGGGTAPSRQVLYAVYSKDGQSGGGLRSALCSFPLDQINKKMEANRDTCYTRVREEGRDIFYKPFHGEQLQSQCGKHAQGDSLRFPCGSEHLPYPLGSRDGLVGEPLLQKEGLKLTAVAVATEEGHNVAFLGTSNGQILKVFLAASGDATEYGTITVDLNKRIKNDLLLSADGLNIYSMTQDKVFRLPVQDCTALSTCLECRQSMDPYCGWCVFEGRCTRRTDCSQAEEADRWLWSRNSSCPAVTSAQPQNMSRRARGQVRLTVSPFPTWMETTEFLCQFGQEPSHPAHLDSGTIVCDSPVNVPPTPQGQDHVAVPITLTFMRNMIFFTSHIYPFYDCKEAMTLTTNLPCISCASNRWNCQWDLKYHVCRESSPNPEEGIIKSNMEDGCPQFLDPNPLVIPMNHETDVTFQGKNLDSVQMTSLMVGNELLAFEKPAIMLEEGRFSFRTPKLSLDTIETVPLNLYVRSYGKHIDSKLQVTLYNCSFGRSDCSLCLAASSEYQCVWCGGQGRCLYQASCSDPTTQCPNPVITKIQPETGPLGGGIRLTIMGSNLGVQASDVQRITVAGRNCTFYPALYSVSTRIVCTVEPGEENMTGGIEVDINGKLGQSPPHVQFKYQKPQATKIEPIEGPLAGGTLITVTGDYLDTGFREDVNVSLGNIPCVVVSFGKEITCRTGPSSSLVEASVSVTYGSFLASNGNIVFFYRDNPVVQGFEPGRSFMSGGRNINVTGQGFALIQNFSMVVIAQPVPSRRKRRQARNPQATTVVGTNVTRYSDTKIVFLSPPLPEYSEPYNITTLLQMDGHRVPLKTDSSTFEYVPDPTFENFTDGIKKQVNKLIHAKGTNLNKAMTIHEAEAFVGEERCFMKTLTETDLYCEPPEVQPPPKKRQKRDTTANLPEFTVRFGTREWTLGRVEYDTRPSDTTLSVILPLVIIPMVAIIAISIYCYRRKSQQAEREYEKIKSQLEGLEESVRDRCKKEFTDLMIEMEDQTNDVSDAGIPVLDYKTYTDRVFFLPSKDGEKDVMITGKLDIPEARRQTVEQALNQFSNLLNSKTFLITFIHTLENQREFSARAKVYFASLLTVALHGKLEYYTDILRTLFLELMDQYVGAKNPKLMLRRSETVVERMLSNWMSICLYQYLKDSAGEPLYKLFKAIKHQVEKGPVDAVQRKAKYTLNDTGLLGDDVEYSQLTVSVIVQDEGTDPVPVKVLNCDTISQVKEKIIDQVYRTLPCSQWPRADSVVLEWRPGSTAQILSDLDLTSLRDGRWRRINTLMHYNVRDGATLLLSKVGVSQQPEDNQQDAPGERQALLEDENKVWHLVRPMDEVDEGRSKRGSVKEKERTKAITEIYLTRLLSVKGTLQQFVDDFFHSALASGHTVPPAVKYFFDFLDEQAERHEIKDEDTIHIWKTNSLPLRFWVNILKNPHFIFDVHVNEVVDASLSVIAQTFMDACTRTEHKLSRDSPSNKLLYAKEISTYKKMVEDYYKGIRQMVQVSDQDMNTHLAEISRAHTDSLNTLVAVHQLYQYTQKYYDEITNALEEDPAAQKMQLAFRLQQIAAALENKVTDL